MDTNYEINNYLNDLCLQVFNNELILSKIFSHLMLKELLSCSLVCHKWRTEAKRIATNRSQSLNIFHLFRTDRQSDQRSDDELNERSNEELDFCSRHHWIDKYDFKKNVIKSMTNGLYSVPEVCLIVYGSFGEDVRLNQRLYQTEIVRKSLPQTNCQILNLNSSCLIGCPTTSSVPIHKITHFGDLAAVSLLLLPKYRNGIDITVFTGTDMREKIFNLANIKSILLFTTSSIFQDNRNLYLSVKTISKFINGFDNRIAFGGYNSAYFSFNKTDFLNYLVNEPNSAELEAREMIGICFSGDNVKSCSLVINTKRVNKTEQKVREFKNSLGFEPKNNRMFETICFMFTDEDKNEAFIKLNIFRSVFVDCPVLGVSGYGQYGYDYWPTIDAKNKKFKFSNKPKPSLRSKKRVVLNTNMTTFVVIRLQKKFI